MKEREEERDRERGCGSGLPLRLDVQQVWHTGAGLSQLASTGTQKDRRRDRKIQKERNKREDGEKGSLQRTFEGVEKELGKVRMDERNKTTFCTYTET